jgi:hypothetical protein
MNLARTMARGSRTSPSLGKAYRLRFDHDDLADVVNQREWGHAPSI